MSTKRTERGTRQPPRFRRRAEGEGASRRGGVVERSGPSRCCEPRHAGRPPCTLPRARTFSSAPTLPKTSISKSTRGSEGPRSRWPKRSPRQARRLTDTIGAAARRGKGVHRPAGLDRGAHCAGRHRATVLLPTSPVASLAGPCLRDGRRARSLRATVGSAEARVSGRFPSPLHGCRRERRPTVGAPRLEAWFTTVAIRRCATARATTRRFAAVIAYLPD